MVYSARSEWFKQQKSIDSILEMYYQNENNKAADII